MMTLRSAQDRGLTQNDWLTSYHSFSFSRYIDRRYMGFRSLRVINEDWIAANSGFPTHPHDNMEIITYVIEGDLAHRDSMGNVETIHQGEIQAMSAGSGITHSEFNPSTQQQTHLYQIWLLPQQQQLQPSYQQISYHQGQEGELTRLADAEGGEGRVKINQDARLYRACLAKHQQLHYPIAQQRGVWLQCVRGELQINKQLKMQTGDGLAVEEEAGLQIQATQASEFLLFDLA
ncbi:MAG: pirin family protein [Thiomicrospira sp.]